jgi:hypothetical protein
MRHVPQNDTNAVCDLGHRRNGGELERLGSEEISGTREAREGGDARR